MLDRRALAALAPLLNSLARGLLRLGLSANGLTLLGFALGLMAALMIALGHSTWAPAGQPPV
jgi:hypothetical protein